MKPRKAPKKIKKVKKRYWEKDTIAFRKRGGGAGPGEGGDKVVNKNVKLFFPWSLIKKI